MANPPKRQKTLLGYFTLSEPGKSNQCSVGGQAISAQDRLCDCKTTSAGLERPQHTVQGAGAPGTAAQGPSMWYRPSVCQTDRKTDTTGSSNQPSADISLPRDMVADGTTTSSSDGSESSSGLLPAEADSTASGKDPQDTAPNQYEQQV